MIKLCLNREHEFECTASLAHRKYCSRACEIQHKRAVFEETAERRFWARVDKSGDCWEWAGGSLDRDGYGRVWFRGKYEGAHRIAYQLGHEEIPGKLHVLHRCDNPRCCNPDHLFLGTNADNIRDMCTKGRAWRQQPGNAPRGFDDPRSKFLPNQIAFIRDTYASKSMNGVELAKMFRVGTSTIYRIIKGKAY